MSSIYILLAERAARALGDLHMVSNEFTLEQASAFASANTPRGWLSLKGNLVRGEQHLYLQQPGYGTSYLIGKMQIEMLLAKRKAQLGDKFSMRAVHGRVQRRGTDPGVAAAVGADGGAAGGRAADAGAGGAAAGGALKRSGGRAPRGPRSGGLNRRRGPW